MILKLCQNWRNAWVSWLLRFGVAAAILTLLFFRIDLDSVLNVLSEVRIQFLVPILLLFFSVRYIWAYQRSLGLAPLCLSFTVAQLFKIILASTFYSLVLPGSIVAGSVASWYKLSRSNGKPVEAGALVIYFRLVNTLTRLGLGLFCLWFDSQLTSPILRVLVGVMSVGVVLALLPFVSPAVTRWMERLGRPLLHRAHPTQRLQVKGQTVWMALTAFQTLNKRTIGLVFGLSFLSNILAILIWYLLALAINIRLSILTVGWISSLLAVVQMIPVSVAGLGVREVSLVVLLRDYGIPQAQALSFSLGIFSLMVLEGTVGGLLEAWDLLQGGRRFNHPASEQRTEVNTEMSAW